MRINIPVQITIFGLLTYCATFVACDSKSEGGQSSSNERQAEGKNLSDKYCGSCHLSPDPSLLDKETWSKRVLPAMAKQLGLEVWRGNNYYQNEKSAISQSDWMKIVAYYDSLSPIHLSVQNTPEPLIKDWSIFSLKKPKTSKMDVATTTMVVIDSSDKFIYTSESEHAKLYQWGNNLKNLKTTQLLSPAVNMIFQKKGDAVITCIGEIKAVDIPNGNIATTNILNKESDIKSITSNLIRPINTISSDFNKDGLTDYIVCSFGHNQGGLFLLKQLPDKSFQKFLIREAAGATQSIAGDFNSDGWPDVMTLFAHGDEGIWLFLNNKKGGFETTNILRFPPVYGSSSFQLVDMNKDGKPDIIYTSGDNSDYSRILKPYHGLYIFTNTGNFNDPSFSFKQSYFYPINGCTKAIALDFDQDGDMDIATIAFYADFINNSSEGFIYFENEAIKRTSNFKPHAVPVHESGRWICMDSNDYDGDGDQDIVLGNYSKGFINQAHFKADWDIVTPFVILENNTKNSN